MNKYEKVISELSPQLMKEISDLAEGLENGDESKPLTDGKFYQSTGCRFDDGDYHDEGLP